MRKQEETRLEELAVEKAQFEAGRSQEEIVSVIFHLFLRNYGSISYIGLFIACLMHDANQDGFKK